MISRCLAICFFLCAICAGFAEVQSGHLHIKLVFSDGRTCDLHVRVVLLSGPSSIPIADVYSADDGAADFGDLASGSYHVQVSGPAIEDADSGRIDLNTGNGTPSIFVTVKRLGETRGREAHLPSATVTSAELTIPEAARKIFEQAKTLMAKQSWNKAKEELMKAVAIYPQYAAAYNNLGVVYARLGDRAHERESLQTAIRLDEHCSAALVNLATMAVVDHDLRQAEPLLNRAAAADPNNVETLILLAKVQFAQQHWEAAVATCHRVHFIHLGEEPFGHYIAAKALRQEKRDADATAQLQTFLEEEPTGPRADSVRKEMAAMALNR